ncbi:DUF3515 domain-containing protein [Micromonospora sp. SH-82]|uniref:DUF3515 domain-containing protein n=1 Tax=Micromonospora sp. SH-82 TaxID=3132938 RepID=UPI003EBB57FF
MDESTETSSGEKTPDRTNRNAAWLATAVAVPVTLLVAGLAFAQLRPDDPAGSAASPSPTSARPQSSAPVDLPAPDLAERPTVVCRALLSQLPPTVGGLAQRPVTAGPEQNAAYGDPALTVTCGGPAATFDETDEVWTVNRVCWHGADEADATVFTTVDREVPVQVTVPKEYDQPLQWLPAVSNTVVESVRSGGTPPSGCGG